MCFSFAWRIQWVGEWVMQYLSKYNMNSDSISRESINLWDLWYSWDTNWKWNPSVMSDSLWPMDCRQPSSSIHGISQARILEWVAISFSRGSSWPRDRTQVSCITGRLFTVWATRESLLIYIYLFIYLCFFLRFILGNWFMWLWGLASQKSVGQAGRWEIQAGADAVLMLQPWEKIFSSVENLFLLLRLSANFGMRLIHLTEDNLYIRPPDCRCQPPHLQDNIQTYRLVFD